ncbi:hypothetical protein [Metallibacterium scheffleri]|uniref:Uncharacterized protein n=1 Tax=Metallibacterium scheffleri TaxID=993689 RepID=A0A4S3KU54_9GAMM|nr:hypothetical protein [Metallibacterium scheffleri]THD11998.1 hypothetical protein B1806_01315 [Metallibacterium scheffleri]
MTANTENLILELLRVMRADITSIKDGMREVKGRLTSLEAAIAALRRDHLGAQEDVYRQQAAIDRLAERMDRVEKRLELQD